jgi:rhodanese-related sulfurtransferase
MTQWRSEQRPVARVRRLELDRLPALVRSDPSLQILDVREKNERDTGFIPGSQFLPWHDIDGLPEELDPQRPVAVVCASGQRAAVAASLLQLHGAQQVIHVVGGGVPTWRELGQPIVGPQKAAA